MKFSCCKSITLLILEYHLFIYDTASTEKRHLRLSMISRWGTCAGGTLLLLLTPCSSRRGSLFGPPSVISYIVTDQTIAYAFASNELSRSGCTVSLLAPCCPPSTQPGVPSQSSSVLHRHAEVYRYPSSPTVQLAVVVRVGA